MPAAITYPLDQTTPEARVLEDAYAKEHDARLKVIDLRWAYYRGEMHKPLQIEQDGVDDNVLLPKVAEIADKLRSFLLGEGVQFDTDPSTGDRTERDNQLDAIWRANNGKRLLSELALSGILSGHCFVQVVPQQGQAPRLINVDPRAASVFWDVQDVSMPLWYRLQYSAGGIDRRIDYVSAEALGNTGDQWYEWVYQRGSSANRWQESQSGLLMPFLPLIDWPNQTLPFAYYGQDDIAAALALNDSINLIASDYARILKHHAAPRTVGIGMDAADVVGSAVSGFYTVNKPTSEAHIYNLEMQSDLKAAFDYLQFLIREAWYSGRMVDPATVKDALGQLTNFGLRVMMADGLSKTVDKRELYGEGLDHVCRTALLAAGLTPPERVIVTWPDILPEDPAMVATLQSELAAKIISRQTYREIRGYDQEQEDHRLQEESAADDTLGARLLDAFSKGA
jgi:hypothetical protein